MKLLQKLGATAVLAGATLAIIAAVPQGGAVANASIELGKAAPALSLPDSNGKTVNVNDFKGKYVVLEWLNHDCPYVMAHYDSGNMPGLQKELTKKGVVWLSIISSAPGTQGHVNGEQANANTKKKGASPTHVLLDPDGKIGRAYGAKTTPHMYVIDPTGNVIYHGGIDNNRQAKGEEIKKSRNHVREALTEAMAGKEVSVKTSQPYGCSVKYAN